MQLVAQDLKEIVDKEGLSKVVSVGHDWVSGQSSCGQKYIPFTVVSRVPVSHSASTTSTRIALPPSSS